MSDELFDKLRDVLNELETAGRSMHVGTWQNASTDWYSVPYLVDRSRTNIEVWWSQRNKRWETGRDK
ncbi:hypothetical protein ACFRJ3_34995 [Streptomyces sp. NPDC056696]|uniref:hypothetical protein n=1 Tax=unclassified Streptomyces TaxID=2593676 RepID=UPI00364976B6